MLEFDYEDSFLFLVLSSVYESLVFDRWKSFVFIVGDKDKDSRENYSKSGLFITISKSLVSISSKLNKESFLLLCLLSLLVSLLLFELEIEGNKYVLF